MTPAIHENSVWPILPVASSFGSVQGTAYCQEPVPPGEHFRCVRTQKRSTRSACTHCSQASTESRKYLQLAR